MKVNINYDETRFFFFLAKNHSDKMVRKGFHYFTDPIIFARKHHHFTMRNSYTWRECVNSMVF